MSTPEYHIQFLLRGSKGGFAWKIAEAWQAADDSNREKLEKAFPSIFTPEPKVWEGNEIHMAPIGYYWYRKKPQEIPSLIQLLDYTSARNSKVWRYVEESSSTAKHIETDDVMFGPIQIPVF